MVRELVHEEENNPSPSKVYDDRRIYPHRNFGDLRGPPGRPKIADFGLAVVSLEDHAFTHPIQPDLLQSPEVILRAGWSYSADIWNLGVMVRVFCFALQYYRLTEDRFGIYWKVGHSSKHWIRKATPTQLMCIFKRWCHYLGHHQMIFCYEEN